MCRDGLGEPLLEEGRHPGPDIVLYRLELPVPLLATKAVGDVVMGGVVRPSDLVEAVRGQLHSEDGALPSPPLDAAARPPWRYALLAIQPVSFI